VLASPFVRGDKTGDFDGEGFTLQVALLDYIISDKIVSFTGRYFLCANVRFARPYSLPQTGKGDRVSGG